RERVRYENELRESEVRYRAIFENTGTATVIVDEQMNVVMANKQFVLLSGFSKEEIEGKKGLKDFLHQDDLLAWDGCEEPPSGQEFRIVGRKGDVFHVLANVDCIPSTTQKVLSLLDITKLKKTEKEKREVLLYTKNQLDAGIDPLMTISIDGKIMDANRATESVTGLTRDALIGSDFAYLFTEPSKARKGYLEILSKGFIRDYPLAIQHVSGRLTEVLYNAWLYRNEEGEVQGIFAAARDITEWVAAEKKILASNEMLRLMTSELLMTEEREQRRIAAELHDNIGQTLALAKIKLDSLLNQASASGVTKPLLDIREMVNLSIAQTRSLMGEINPSILKELGLTEAIKGLCEKIRERKGLRILLKADPKIGQPDEQSQFLIFRAVRELLMNVVKHASAKRVSIRLKKIGESLMVAVKDDGVGFDLASIDQVKARTAGFGLLSIRESLNHMGGLCEIETQEGKGTSVVLTVPLKWRKASDA
ncbi:MAG: PAS domain-containing sensor histidine kinase, partial [Deltaproteobacteria bacterium]